MIYSADSASQLRLSAEQIIFQTAHWDYIALLTKKAAHNRNDLQPLYTIVTYEYPIACMHLHIQLNFAPTVIV